MRKKLPKNCFFPLLFFKKNAFAFFFMKTLFFKGGGKTS